MSLKQTACGNKWHVAEANDMLMKQMTCCLSEWHVAKVNGMLLITVNDKFEKSCKMLPTNWCLVKQRKCIPFC